MKNLIPLTLISVLFLSACSATYQGSALYDDVYYGATENAPINDIEYASPEYVETDYVYEGDEYIEESNYQDSLRDYNDDDYYLLTVDNPYTSRIMRFHGPEWRVRYYNSLYDYPIFDSNIQWGSSRFMNRYYPYLGLGVYNAFPMHRYNNWAWGLGFGWNSYNGFNIGFGMGFGGYGYGNYGYGGYGHYGYGGYGNYGYGGYGGSSYYGHGYFGNNSFRDVQYGHRKTSGQINSDRSIRTPRDARGYNTKTKSINGEARSTRGSRTTHTEQSGSVGLIGGLQKQDNKTTPIRTRSIVNGTNTKAKNQNAREQKINSNRQRYTRTARKYNKPGVYSKSRTATNSRQYTSPQRNSRSSQKYTTSVKNTNKSIRRITKPSTRTQRYSTPSRSTKNLKSSSSKSTRSYSTKSRAPKSKSSRSYSSGSRSSSSASRSSSSGSRSSSSSSKGSRKR